MGQEDLLKWTQWLYDTRIDASPHAEPRPASLFEQIFYDRGTEHRCIRPHLSRINMHVLSILDTTDVPVTDPNFSRYPEKKAPWVSLRATFQERSPSDVTAHTTPTTCTKRPDSVLSAARNATLGKPWSRPFASAFKKVSLQDVPLGQSGRTNKARRAHPDKGRISYLAALTVHATVTFHLAKPALGRVPAYLRGPTLTKTTPQDRVAQWQDDGQGRDTRDHSHIFYRYDIIPTQTTRYLVLAALGAGAYGQVLKCQDLITRELVAIKVVKYHSRPYRTAYQKEKDILRILNAGDPNEKYHIIRLKETFYFHDHGCLVFMSGGPSLIACLRDTVYRGLPLEIVHNHTVQLLIAIRYMHHSGWVHTDLKPDNVLTDNDDPFRLWLIDFGLAEHVSSRAQETYKQTRYYRAPETILRCQTTSAIDLWSLGCICAELYLGFPLFAAKNEFDQLRLIDKIRGPLPRALLDRAPGVHSFFEYRGRTWLYLSREEALHRAERNLKRYVSREKRDKLLQGRSIAECIYAQASNKGDIEHETHLALFIDFLERLLTIDPDRRITVDRALKHEFVKLQLPGKIWLEKAFGEGKEAVLNSRVRHDDQPSIPSSPSSEHEPENPKLGVAAPLQSGSSNRIASFRGSRFESVKQQQSAQSTARRSPGYRARQAIRSASQPRKASGSRRSSHAGQVAQWLNAHLQVPSRRPSRPSQLQQEIVVDARSELDTGPPNPSEHCLGKAETAGRSRRD